MSTTNPPSFLHPFAKPTAGPGHFTKVARAEGAAIFDEHGKRYVDGIASLWYCSVGHGRHEIADAVRAQMMTMETYSTFDMFTNDPADQLSAELAARAPMPDARVFFTSGGSEAVDSAIKIARIAHVQAGHPERTIVISREGAYHGVNYGGLSAGGLPLNQAGFGTLLPDMLRAPRYDLDAVGAICAQNKGKIAAIIAEPVQGAAGVYPATTAYLAGLRALADQHGAYLIFDEVICGFGRLGSFWGAQHYGVTPDLVTFAKAVTAGYIPLGGVLVGRSVREPLESDPAFMFRHGYTYSGHASACAAGLAVLDIMDRESLVARAKPIGERLSAGLHRLLEAGHVAEVRGDGAIWAVGLNPGQDPMAVRMTMMHHGAIARPIAPSTIAFCPPLVIDDADVDVLVDALEAGVTVS
jgi:putrescine---pyruvate transaminase